jgi:hypothetical protein
MNSHETSVESTWEQLQQGVHAESIDHLVCTCKQTGVAGSSAFARVPEPEVANLVESFEQHVLEEPAHELGTFQRAGAPAVGLPVLVAKGDGAFVEGDDARVGNGDAEDVASQVSQHGVFTLTPAGDPDNPGLRPGAGGDDEVGPLPGKVGLELAAHELGDGRLGGKEGGTRRMPARVSAGRDAAACDEAMHVGVVEPSLKIPGIIISLIFSEQRKLVFRATPQQN